MSSSLPPSSEKKRGAVYLRISKRDGSQTEKNQRRQLRDFIEEQGYALASEYVDHESGRKGRRERSGFDEVFEAAYDPNVARNRRLMASRVWIQGFLAAMLWSCFALPERSGPPASDADSQVVGSGLDVAPPTPKRRYCKKK